MVRKYIMTKSRTIKPIIIMKLWVELPVSVVVPSVVVVGKQLASVVTMAISPTTNPSVKINFFFKSGKINVFFYLGNFDFFPHK